MRKMLQFCADLNSNSSEMKNIRKLRKRAQSVDCRPNLSVETAKQTNEHSETKGDQILNKNQILRKRAQSVDCRYERSAKVSRSFNRLSNGPRTRSKSKSVSFALKVAFIPRIYFEAEINEILKEEFKIKECQVVLNKLHFPVKEEKE